jgi:hypothetical protein
MLESWGQIFLKRRIHCFKPYHRVGLFLQATNCWRLHTVEISPFGNKWFSLIEPNLLLDVFGRVINHDLRLCLKFASIIRIFLPSIICHSPSSNSWSVKFDRFDSEQTSGIGIQTLLQWRGKILPLSRGNIIQINFDDARHDVSSLICCQIDIDFKILFLLLLLDTDISVHDEKIATVGLYFWRDGFSCVLEC